MFFNTDILYRNGPLALVWLAGNGNIILRNGPGKKRYKNEIMRADLHTLIKLISDQLPTVGSDKGLSLKKVVYLFNGIVVMHHMQLEISLKRINQLYMESCRRNLFEENTNAIDAPIPATKDRNLVTKPQTNNQGQLNISDVDIQLLDVPESPRALPHLEIEYRLPAEDSAGFDYISSQARDEFLAGGDASRKRKDDDLTFKVPVVPAKSVKLNSVENAGISIAEDLVVSNVVEQVQETFEDWNFGNVENEGITCENENILFNDFPEANENIPREHEHRYDSPLNRHSTIDNEMVLAPLQAEKQVRPRFSGKRKRIEFNEETELSNDVIRNQARAALGVDGNTHFSGLQNRAASTRAVPRKVLEQQLKGMNFIDVVGRQIIGAHLRKFQSFLILDIKHYWSGGRIHRAEISGPRGANNTTAGVSGMDSRDLVGENVYDTNVPDDPNVGNPWINDHPEIMEPVVIPCDAMDEDGGGFGVVPGEVSIDISNGVRYESLVQDPDDLSTLIDDNFVFDALNSGAIWYSEIFPHKISKLQAARGFMHLLRMQSEKKILMKQSGTKSKSRYGAIHIILYEKDL